MLSAVTLGATSVKKQIVVAGGVSAVVYTVPIGKTFVGAFFCSATANIMVTINSVQVPLSAQANVGTQPFQITLLAGTTVTGNGTYGQWTLIGVES